MRARFISILKRACYILEYKFLRKNNLVNLFQDPFHEKGVKNTLLAYGRGEGGVIRLRRKKTPIAGSNLKSTPSGYYSYQKHGPKPPIQVKNRRESVKLKPRVVECDHHERHLMAEALREHRMGSGRIRRSHGRINKGPHHGRSALRERGRAIPGRQLHQDTHPHRALQEGKGGNPEPRH